MAVTLPGATPVQNALSQLGALPEQDRARLAKNGFDSIARETSIPANVLMALDEAEGGSGNIQRARENALKLGEAVKAGAKIEDAVTSLAGNPDKGKSILDRSYAIADAIYPASTPATPPEAEGYGIGTALADVGKKVVAGGISGLGSVAREAGIVVDEVLKDSIGTLGSREVGKAPDPVEGETLARAGGRAAQGVLDAGADAVRDTVSEEGQKRAKGTNLSGELLSPSTWDFGDDPSVSGLVLNAAEGVGSMIPMVASRGPVGAAIMGGLMAGGEGAENGRQFVIDAARVLDENGEPEIAKLPEYQKLRAAGKSHEQATMDLARVAETEAGFRQSVVGALGGAATNRIFRSAEGWMGTGGRVARAAKKGTAGFFEEGAQEAIEGGAALSGIGAATGGDMNLAEDSFGNFVMGGLSGGAMGAAGGMLFGENEAAAQPETETEAQAEGQAAIAGPDQPLMLPPPDRGLPGPGVMGALPAPDVPPQLPGPTNGGTIFGEGRPGVEPNAIERDPNNPRAPRDEIINGPAQFRPGPPNATADGSGDGAVVAPGGGSFLSASPGAATSSPPGPLALPAPDSGGTIFGAGRPGLEPNAIERDPNNPRAPRDQIISGPAQFRPGQSNATAPMEAPPAGPIGAIARSIKMPEPPPVAPPVRFPEHKPGSAVRLGDPDSGQIFDGVFLGESEQGAHVRIGGREEILAPEVFDMGRDAVAQIEAQQKEAAKAPPATPDAPPVTPAAPPAAPPLATDPDMLIEPIEGNQPQAQQNMGAPPETLPQGNQPTPTVEDIRDRASVLRGVDRNNPPAIPGVSMKWDDRADGFIFSRKHADAVRAAVSGTPAPQPQPKPPGENDVPTAHRRPFIDRVKAWGGINPTGKVAEELRHRGVTSRTAPGLYRRNGYKDMDNIPANEHPDLIGALAFDPSSGYFDQEAIIAAIADEIGGRPLAFGQHAIDQQETRNHWSPNRQADRAASAGPVRSGVADRESDIRTDDERRTDISRGVMADIQDLGLDGVLTRDEIAAIIDQIDRDGGNTRDAIHDTIVRSERDGIQSGSGDSRAAGPLSDIPFGDEGESERFARAAGAVGTEPQGQDSGSPEQAGRDNGVSAPDRAQVEQAAAAADPEPTDAQKEAGNYRKGHVLWNGLDLTIENAKGSTRSGKSADGKEWSVTMPAHYGYFKRSEGADGDHVDFYLGDVPDSDYVMIIDQVHADTGAFDEHKVIIGTTARGAALDLYLDGFSDGRGEDRIGNFSETTVGTLKSWLQSGDTSKPTKALTHPFRRKPIEKAEEKPKAPAPAKAKAEPRFPTTLEDIAPKPRAGEGRMTHIYAEYRGQRFYLASVQGNGEGPAAEWRKTYPGAAIYTTDRADGTSINGDIVELDAAVSAQAAPKAKAPANDTYATAADWSREVLKRLRERIEAGFSPKVRLSRTRAISLRRPDQVDETLRVGRSGDIEVQSGNSWDALGIVEADELAGSMGMPARFEAVTAAERTEAPSMFEQIEARAEALGVSLSGDEIGRIIADERRGETVEAAVDRFLANRQADDDAAAPTVEPGAEGLPQTVIPGAERSEAQAKAALSDRQRLELEARQKQSKIRRLGGNDGDAGPLFGNVTDDLFAAPSQPAPAQPSKPTGEDLLQHGRKIIVRHANADDEVFDEQAGRDLRATPTGRKLADDLAKAEGFDARKKVADAWVLESGRAMGVEHLVVLNKDGVPLAIMSGHKSGVSMHAAVWRAAEAGEVAYAVHNHPTSGGPSPADVAISHMGFPVMKIMAHGGAAFEFSAATEMGATKFEANGDLFRDNAPYQALDAIYHRTMTELNRAAWALPGLEGQTDKQAEAFARAIKPAFSLVLERLGVINYTGPGVDEITAAGFNFEEIYGQVSGFGRDRLGRAGFNLPAASDREGDQPSQGRTGPAPRERDGADRAAGTDAKPGRRKAERVPAETVTNGKSKIEDFGEKIGGARKDVWSGYADRMTEAEALDIGAVPLSQSWPAPDYEKLIEAGVEPWKVGFIRAARDAIPTKPQNAYKVRSWVETVTALRGIANGIMAGEIEESAVSGKLVGTGRPASLIRGQMKLYAAVGHSKSLKGLGFGQVSYTMLAGVRYDPAKSFWEVTAAAPSSAFSNMPKTLARAETEAEAIDAFKKVHAKLGETQEKGKKKPKFLIYSHNDRKFFTVGVKLGSTYLQLRKVDTVQEARRIIAEESDALEDQLKKLREIPADRKAENAPRVGVDHRGGVDVTAKQFAETFGFRGVEFGNWVEGKRRQEDLNNAYDALMDMAGVLDIPPKAISLNGALGLAFGARGSGGVSPAAAHYEPGKVVINLTKMNGAGSLGHEWFHAVDHHLAKQVQTRTGSAAPIEYLTNNVTPGKHVTGLRGEVADAFIALRHAIGKTDLKKRSERIDQTRSTPYWATQIELHARAFESYLIAKLQDQSVSNDYLANVVEGIAWQMKAELSGLGDSYPYLKEDEIEVVRAAFDALFDTIQTRETDKGTDLYQRDMKMGAMAAPEVPSGILRGVSDVVGQILRAHGLDRAVSPKVVRNLLSKSGVPVLGSYRGGEIKVNAGAADPGHVVRHEIIHALRDANLWGQPYGLFTGQEWRALVRAARADEGIRRAVERAYGDLDAAGQAEEMVAEFYADWAADRAKYPPGPVLRALERIHTFFRALGAALRGEGFMDAAMVMDRIANGEIGGRGGPEGGPRGGVRESRGNADQTAYQRTPLRLDRALIGGDLASISGHADYQAAKAGDVAAAVRLAKDIVTDDLVQRVRAAIKGHSPMILPVVSIEASGRNKIPAAAAEVLAARLGLDAAQGIVQSNAPRRTSLAGLDRIFASPEFEGEVVAGQEYLILDDTLTQGGTFAALAGHIESGGGRVIGSVALTGKQYSATLQPTPETLSALRAKHGDIEQDFLAATGHGFDSLTESEARYLANFKPAQAVRDRILAERGRGGSREDQGDAAGGQVSREQRDLSGLKASLSRSKGGVLGMLGNLDWKRTPKEAGELFSNFLTDAMGRNARFNILSLVPGQPLFAELGKRLPAAQEYLGLKQAMDADRNKWQSRSAAAVDRWTQLARRNPEANAALMDLMHRTTLAQSDPTKDEGWRRMVDAEADRVTSKDRKDRQEWAAQIKADRAKRKAVHDEMRAAFDKLPKDFQKLYADIRDEYSALADAVDAALMENIRVQSQITLKKADREYRKEVARINDEGLTGPARTEALGKANEVRAKAQARAARGQGSRLTQLRQLFEQNRLDGPYFPLARFGNYFVTIRDADKKVVSFSRFESESAQKAWAESAEAKALGKVQTGVLGMSDADSAEVDPRFIAEIEGLLDDAGADRKLMDAVYQRWLETLPDQSIRTSQIHRKGRAGFNKDAVRAFASSMFHGAHQAARLRFGAEMAEALEVAEEQAAESDNPNRAGFVVREMKQRHEFTMNPTNNPWVSKATGLAFVWYLGMSPAAALVNVSQTTIVGVPMMAARFRKAGLDGTIKELTKASADFMRGRGKVTKRVGGVPVMSETWSIENAPNLTQDERKAMQAGYDLGVIDKTQSHDLASVADSGIEYNATREKIMRVIGWGFHHTERFNREVTYLAAYRLARQEGLTHATAVSAASSMVWKTHFDYSNTSKPRAMQGDAAKVFLIFRNFTFNMLFRLFRDTHQALNGASKEDRREARAQLIGVTLSMMGHAGIRGVWGYGLLTGLLALFFPGDGDDMDEWLQDALLMEGDDLGTAGWNWIMGLALNGVPGHALGLDLTNRIGMPDLFLRSPDRDMEGKDLWAFYVEQFAGPAFGIGGSLFTGASMVADGEFLRGFEKMVPTFARNVIKGGRYATEGVTTYYGDDLVDGLNPWQVLMQMQGFTPAEVAERYDINNRLVRHERRIEGERSDIIREIGDAVRAGEDIPEASIERMREFNARVPEYPITRDNIRNSVQSRNKASARNEMGVGLNPKLNTRLREDRAPALY
jgi:hypothetical protein